MLNKLGFGRSPSAAKEAAASPVEKAMQVRQYLSKYRELARLAVKATLKEHGMDASWVGCSVLLTTPGDPGRAADALEVRLIVQVWREELLRYLPALQSKIAQAISQAEPSFDHDRHAVTWQFAPDCGCPVSDMPLAERWQAKPAAQSVAATPAPPQGQKRRFDLPPSELDQIRDVRDDIPSIFATSQPGFLNTQPIDWPKPDA